MSDMAFKAARVAVEAAGAAERQFKESNPTFYSDYKKPARSSTPAAARNLPRRPLRHQRLR
jgi:hypothetical protein